MFAKQSWLHRRTHSNFYLEYEKFTSVRHWLQGQIVMPTWIYISIIIATSIIGYVVSILIRKTKDATKSKKTIIIGSSGISTTSSLLIWDLCRSLNVRLTNGGRKNTPLIIAVSSNTNEFEIYSPCSFTSLQAFVRSFGKNQTYLTRSNKLWKVYLRKYTKGLENIIIDNKNTSMM